MNDNALDKGIQEYIPQKLFITGGDESGKTATCQGDSGKGPSLNDVRSFSRILEPPRPLCQTFIVMSDFR